MYVVQVMRVSNTIEGIYYIVVDEGRSNGVKVHGVVGSVSSSISHTWWEPRGGVRLFIVDMSARTRKKRSFELHKHTHTPHTWKPSFGKNDLCMDHGS